MKTTRTLNLQNTTVINSQSHAKNLSTKFWMRCLAAAATIANVSNVYADPDALTVDGITVFSQKATLASPNILPKGGEGTLIFNHDNSWGSSTGMESGATIDVRVGKLQAACANAFGSAKLRLAHGTRLQGGDTSATMAALTISNNIIVGEAADTAGATVTISTRGVLLAAEGSINAATYSSVTALTLSGTLQENYLATPGAVAASKITFTNNNGTDSVTGKIILSGDNQVAAASSTSGNTPGDLSGGITVAGTLELCLGHAQAIPSTLTDGIIMGNGTKLSTTGTTNPTISSDASVKFGTLAGADETVAVNVNTADALTINSALSAYPTYTSTFGCTVDVNGSGTLILGSTSNTSATKIHLKLSSGIAQVASETRLPGGVLTFNGGTLKTTGEVTLSAVPTIVNATTSNILDIGNGLAFNMAGGLGAPSQTSTLTLKNSGYTDTNATFSFSDTNTAGTTEIIVYPNVSYVVNSTLANEFSTSAAFKLHGGVLLADTTAAANSINTSKVIALTDNSYVNVNGTTNPFTLSSSPSGAFRITKNGDGTLVFGASNTVSGQKLTIDAGKVAFADGMHLPGNGEAGLGTPAPRNGKITFASSSTTLEARGTTTLTNLLDLTADATLSVTNTNVLTVNQAIISTTGGTKTLTTSAPSGTGTVILGYDYTAAAYTTDKTISTGVYDNYAHLTIGANSLVKIDHEKYLPRGTISLNTGTLHASDNVSLGTVLTMAGNGTIDIADGKTFQMPGNLDSNTLTLENTVTHSGTGVGTFYFTSKNDGSSSGDNGSTNIIVGSNVQYKIVDTAAIEMPGTGTFTLNGGTLFTDATTATATTITSAKAIALNGSSNIKVTGGTLTLTTAATGVQTVSKVGVGTLKFALSGSATDGQTLNIKEGVVEFSDPTHLIGYHSTPASATAISLGVDVDNTSGTLFANISAAKTLSNPLTVLEDSTLQVKKTGDGTVKLTLGGAITGSNKKLTIAPPSSELGIVVFDQTGSDAKIQINEGITAEFSAANKVTSGDLTLGGTLKNTSAITDFNKAIAINGASAAIHADNQLVLTSGVTGESGTLTKTGTDKLKLGAPNTFEGTLAVSAGTLSLTHTNAVAGDGTNRPAITLATTTILECDTATNPTFGSAITATGTGLIEAIQDATLSGLITGSVDVNTTGTGILTLTNVGNSATTGTVKVKGGTLAFETNANLPGSSLIMDGGTLHITGNTIITRPITFG